MPAMPKTDNVVELPALATAHPYKPADDRERRALEDQKRRRGKGRPVPRLEVEQIDRKAQVAFEHADGATGFTLFMESIGTANHDFAQGILNQVLNASQVKGSVNVEGLNFSLAAIAGIEPRDHVEAMLATQMAAIHTATMNMTRVLANATQIPQQDSAERALNKLAQTFAAQVEALKRHRSKGEQRVIVERVTVEKGGQAIVGHVTTKGGVSDECER